MGITQPTSCIWLGKKQSKVARGRAKLNNIGLKTQKGYSKSTTHENKRWLVHLAEVDLRKIEKAVGQVEILDWWYDEADVCEPN